MHTMLVASQRVRVCLNESDLARMTREADAGRLISMARADGLHAWQTPVSPGKAPTSIKVVPTVYVMCVPERDARNVRVEAWGAITWLITRDELAELAASGSILAYPNGLGEWQLTS